MSTLNSIEEKPIITVKEARKLMGKFAEKHSDEQLQKLISDLDMIAMLQLNMVPKVTK
ncbi:MAG: hypothetical protein JNK33_01020 [Candidatus Doudnabacteria bacterium]|nr:hypothetical protein [Candidatus Doudnabacteria bacterium]